MSLRIAMWTCPRNISTAMMRAWGNRADTYVCDEPLYAYYLNSTGKIHPATAEIMASQPKDWHKVVKWLMGPIPDDSVRNGPGLPKRHSGCTTPY